MGKFSVAGSVLIAITACSVAPVTFMSGGDASGVDATGDVPGTDAIFAPASCRALHGADPGLPSGNYEIDPDGSGGAPPVTVTCDMATDGGGWTIVFFAPITNLTTLPIPYTGGTPRLMADAESVLLAYRDATQVSYPDHARFDLPAAWRTTPPFQVDGTDLTTSVSINGGASAPATLRYGKDTFSTTCKDPWITSVTWGRICIVESRAPFFSGFSHPADDTCTDSLSVFSTTACKDDRRFSIAVR